MLRYLAISGLVVGIWGLGYQTSQDNFLSIFAWFSLSFASYFWLLSQPNQAGLSFSFLQGLSIGLRGLLLFGLPLLSDDLYRFIWDGRLLVQGINPFDHLPAYYAKQGFPVAGLHASLYALLNSPEYFTIYPPIAQGLFYVGAWLFPDQIWANSVFLKSSLLLFEIGTILLLPRLLKRWGLSKERALWYMLNPLIIVELVGNLHFEAAMIFFLVLALYLLTQPRRIWGGLAWAGSIASKLLTLIFLPLFLRRMPWRHWLTFFVVTGLATLLLFLPLLNGVFFNNFGDSLGLYFQKFEFNASFYFLLRAAITPIVGYNPIEYLGPSLALATLLGVLLLVWREKVLTWPSFAETALWAFCLYLLFATTVHPWYLALPVLFGAISGKRFPMVWSALIILTYVKYSPWEDFYYGAVALEYLLTFGFFFYWRSWQTRHTALT